MWVLASRLHPGNGEGGRVWVGPLMLDRKVEAHVSQGGATAGSSFLSVQGCSAHPSFTRGGLRRSHMFLPLLGGCDPHHGMCPLGLTGPEELRVEQTYSEPAARTQLDQPKPS